MHIETGRRRPRLPISQLGLSLAGLLLAAAALVLISGCAEGELPADVDDAAADIARRDAASDVIDVPCGNGVLDDDEQCDDGNRNELDGCTSFCTLNPAAPCTPCEIDADCGRLTDLCIELDSGENVCGRACADPQECPAGYDCAEVDGGVTQCLPSNGACGDCPDNDGDGVCNDDDVCEGGADRVDYDGDGVPNRCDQCPGSDDTRDEDGDSVPDRCECGTQECATGTFCDPGNEGAGCRCPAGFTAVEGQCADNNECSSGLNRCALEARCTNRAGDYDCECPDGYSGSGWECTDVDECADGLDNCDDVATCRNTPGSFVCSCPATGYYDVNGDGTDCETRCPDGCADRATCRGSEEGWFCQCASPYTSSDPATIDCTFDTCSAGDCADGAVCHSNDATFTCVCPAGTASPDPYNQPCVDSDPCDDPVEPCAEGQECVATGTGPADYECLTDHCTPDPCDHGACSGLDEGFECDCEDGWEGDLCDQDIDDCASEPCVHGECSDAVNDYTCACEEGASGTDCEIVPDCWPNTCLNGGICLTEEEPQRCQCPGAFTGDSCELESLGCTPDPCDHGTCTPNGDEYTCECATGWAGTTCNVCAEGYWGPDCAPCTGGGGADQCYGNGTCSDGSAGSGACTSCSGNWDLSEDCNECQEGYYGGACDDICPGGVDDQCSGHGTCADGRTGNGVCDCETGYQVGTGGTCIEISDCTSGSGTYHCGDGCCTRYAYQCSTLCSPSCPPQKYDCDGSGPETLCGSSTDRNSCAPEHCEVGHEPYETYCGYGGDSDPTKRCCDDDSCYWCFAE